MQADRTTRDAIHRRGPYYGYVIVIAGFFIMTAVWGLVQSYGVFLKPICDEFGWSRGTVSGAFSVFMFMLGFIYIGAGKLTDRFGPRVVLTICGILFGAGHLLMANVTHLWQLYLLYGILIAAGASGSYVPLSTTVARWFIKKRGLMTGIVLSGIGAGTTIGPPFISWIISISGWRAAYQIVGAVTLVTIVVSGQFLKRDPSKIGQLPCGYNEVEQVHAPEVKGLRPREALRSGQFWVLIAIYLMCGLAPWSITVHIVAHATDLGVPALMAANILTLIGLFNLVGKVGVGGIADKTGNKFALVISLAVMLASLLWLQLSGQPWMLWLFGAAFGFAWGGASVLLPPLVADQFGLRALGVIVAMVNWAWLMGGATGAFFTGFIFDLTASYRVAFMTSAILVFCGLMLTISLKGIHPSIKASPVKIASSDPSH